MFKYVDIAMFYERLYRKGLIRGLIKDCSRDLMVHVQPGTMSSNFLLFCSSLAPSFVYGFFFVLARDFGTILLKLSFALLLRYFCVTAKHLWMYLST